MTESELIAELEEILRKSNNPDGAFTARDLADALGVAMSTARRRIRAARKAGRIEHLRVRRTNDWGEVQSLKAYRLLGESG